jgi:parallel beta-helix repeat protein
LLNNSIYSISKCENYYINTENNSKIIYVDDDGDADYSKIQDAIDNSSDYDKIIIFDGIYKENLLINKKVQLSGFSYRNTLIDGQFNNNVIDIISDRVLIKNLSIINSGGIKNNAGIFFNSNNNEINNCLIYNTKNGIILNNSNNNNIIKCSFSKNGIALSFIKSNNNSIQYSSFYNNSIGINMDNQLNGTVLYSCFLSNGISCFINNSKRIDLSNCNVSNNCVNIGGIFVVNSEKVNINNSIINHNGVGVSISSSNMINISYCDLNLNTHFAVSLREASKNIEISKCEIKYNKRFGVYIEKNNECSLHENNIYDNYLYDLFSKFSYCNAKRNWWGSVLGPIDFINSFTKNIKSRGGWIKLIPWEISYIESNGVSSNYNFINIKTLNFTINNNIEFIEKDTDLDNVPDWWEEKWGYDPLVWDDHINLDPDKDSLNNVQECYTDIWGSNPFHKDIFLEIDWMNSTGSDLTNKPSKYLVDNVIESFRNHNISLHVDLGLLGGGEELNNICTPFLSFPSLIDIYFDNFLENDLQNPRKGIFHYGIICNKCPDLNFPFYGWDHFDSFAISAQWLKDENLLINKSDLIIGAIIHHLGHTLKLHADVFNGIDNVESTNPFSIEWWNYKNYVSVMNYRYKYKIFTFSDGSNGINDFDDWNNIDFGFFKNSNFK